MTGSDKKEVFSLLQKGTSQKNKKPLPLFGRIFTAIHLF
jgi:hypothetical protein